MNIVATQIRTGMILKVEGELYRVTYTQHVTPGKGVACMQTKLKNIISGKNLEKRFRSADKAEKVDVVNKQMQYLYEDQGGYVFMDMTDFDQLTLSSDVVSEEMACFLAEEEQYTIQFYEDSPIGLELPTNVDLRVTMAPPEIKKATATSSLRPVELENGLTVQAPAFIKEGDIIRVNTDTKEYVERVKT